MRLLLVTNDYPPKPGGIQMYLKNLVDAYPDEILVYAPKDDDAEPHEPGVVRGSRSYMVPSRTVVDDILAVAEPFEPDAVLFGAPHPLPAMGPALRGALGIPFGVLSHGAEVTLPGAFPGSRQALGRILRSADVRFAVSRYTADKVARISGRPATFVGAGVEIDTFTPPDPGGVHDPPVVGCVSRFVPRKGQHRLLEAVARLDRPVRVLLVGKGRKEGSLRAQAEKLGIDAMFAVDVPWGDLPGLYRSMDVFCMPTSSRWGGLEVEGLGLVFLEAAATGLPVLAGDSGGSPETVIPGETGYVVSSVSDIVEGLEILLDDPVRAAEMGAAGRRFVEEEFTWERVIERFVDGFGPHLE
jgi:phosphatidylinositol alpha-1,6-mannosyltransferase